MLVDPSGRDAYSFAVLTGNDLAKSYEMYGMIPGGSTTHGAVGLDGSGNQQVSLALGAPDPGAPSITAILFGANASTEGSNMSVDPGSARAAGPGTPGGATESYAKGMTIGFSMELDLLVLDWGGKFGLNSMLFASASGFDVRGYTYTPSSDGPNFGLMIGPSLTLNIALMTRHSRHHGFDARERSQRSV
jgi:hypothetical protein